MRHISKWTVCTLKVSDGEKYGVHSISYLVSEGERVTPFFADPYKCLLWLKEKGFTRNNKYGYCHSYIAPEIDVDIELHDLEEPKFFVASISII